MNGRVITGLGVATVLVTAVFVVQFDRAPIAHDVAFAAGLTTPWGEPDLQGIWTATTDEPLQRPAKYKDRPFLTDQERAALNAKISEIVGRESDENRRPRGTEQDVAGAYSTAIFTSHLPVGRRTSMIVDPPDGLIPPLTPEEQKRRSQLRDYAFALLQATDACRNKASTCVNVKYGPPSPRRNEPPPSYITDAITGFSGGGAINRADGPEDRNLSERCLTSGLPSFGGYRRIVQSEGAVSLSYDVGQGQGWYRVIPITAAPHVPDSIRQWWGDSRAHWEGSTLVVDVTNFSPKANYQGAHEHLHLVERWTRTDAQTLQYMVTVADPTVWTRPWTARIDFTKQDEKANRIYLEPRCHEGNYGMVAMLTGARSDERAYAAGKGPHPAVKCLSGCGGFGNGFAEDGEDTNPIK